MLELASHYVPVSESEVFDLLNSLEDRMGHTNSAVVMATIKVFLLLTINMAATHQQVRAGRTCNPSVGLCCCGGGGGHRNRGPALPVLCSAGPPGFGAGASCGHVCETGCMLLFTRRAVAASPASVVWRCAEGAGAHQRPAQVADQPRGRAHGVCGAEPCAAPRQPRPNHLRDGLPVILLPHARPLVSGVRRACTCERTCVRLRSRVPPLAQARI